MAKMKDEMEFKHETGICPICGGHIRMKISHVDGFTSAQWLAHAVPAQSDPISLANPLTEVELAARDEVAASKAAFDVAQEELCLFREKMRETKGGAAMIGSRMVQNKDNPGLRAECQALEPILIRQLEAADVRARTASGKWHKIMADRSQRIETLRLEHEQELVHAGKKGKESLVVAGMARIRQIIGA